MEHLIITLEEALKIQFLASTDVSGDFVRVPGDLPAGPSRQP